MRLRHLHHGFWADMLRNLAPETENGRRAGRGDAAAIGSSVGFLVSHNSGGVY